jgi:hypothetical protein
MQYAILINSQYLIFKRTRNFIDENEISLDTKDLKLHIVQFLRIGYTINLMMTEKKRPKYVVARKVRYVNKAP